jgi:hypothetical protein
MPSIAVFVRKKPKELLRHYFAVNDIVMPGEQSWGEPTTTPVFQAINKLDRDTHERVTGAFDRVVALADDAGQNALYSVMKDRSGIANLLNGHARAFWVYLHANETFRRAEEVRYTDDRRRGKQWDGFLSGADLELKRNDEAIEDFRAAVRERFGSPNVHVDVFDRHRQRHGKTDIALVQATVYLEGRPDQTLEFVDGKLDLRDHRPVIEASLTYEPSSGSIEVVAADRKTREDFVRLFAQSLLGAEFTGHHLPVRYYEIDKLRRRFDFPTDAADKIEGVRVNSLRLAPRDTATERIMIECMRGHERTIWDTCATRFGAHNPLSTGWFVTQVKFTITFHREKGASRGKTLPVTITMPHSCDLKDRTERERIIGEKYLKQWNLLRAL